MPVPTPRPDLTRDEKVGNLIVNFSMIMFGIFEGAFTAMATGLTEVMSATGDALAEALGGEQDLSSKERNKASARGARDEVERRSREVFAKLRAEIPESISKKDESFRAYIKDPLFDEGVRIVESHTFDLPRLTEPLSDRELAGYVALITSEDKEFAKLLGELDEWQKTTPKFSGQ